MPALEQKLQGACTVSSLSITNDFRNLKMTQFAHFSTLLHTLDIIMIQRFIFWHFWIWNPTLWMSPHDLHISRPWAMMIHGLDNEHAQWACCGPFSAYLMHIHSMQHDLIKKFHSTCHWEHVEQELPLVTIIVPTGDVGTDAKCLAAETVDFYQEWTGLEKARTSPLQSIPLFRPHTGRNRTVLESHRYNLASTSCIAGTWRSLVISYLG